MLFYVKKYLWLDLTVTLLLGGIGYWGIRYFSLPFNVALNWFSVLQGFVSFLLIAGWTFLVQKGYAIAKGNDYAETLTESLAKEYFGTSFAHAVAGGLTAALGEELFFRGFVQMGSRGGQRNLWSRSLRQERYPRGQLLVIHSRISLWLVVPFHS